MDMKRRISTTAICVTALLVVPLACGGSDLEQTSTTGPLKPTTSSSTSPSTTTTAAPTTADRQALLDDLRTSFGAPGAIAVLRVGDTDRHGVSGFADLAGTELTDETRFRIGSITKSIVASLVLDQVARGNLSLDDKVGDLLPGVVRSDPPISIRMLLDHTSGIFNAGDEGDITADIGKLTDPAMQAQAADFATRYLAGEQVIVPDRLFVALAETHDRYFAPGAGYHYSNVNYHLAGMVLAAVTGDSIADLVRTRIVEPLGLRRTTVAPADASSPDMRSYSADKRHRLTG